GGVGRGAGVEAPFPGPVRAPRDRRAGDGVPGGPRRPLPAPVRGDRARRVRTAGGARHAYRPGAVLSRRPRRARRVPPAPPVVLTPVDAASYKAAALHTA